MPNTTVLAAGEAMPKYALSAAIHRYRAEVNAYMANCLEAEGCGDDDMTPTYIPAMRILESWNRPAEDFNAAVMALQLAIEDYEVGETPRIPAMMKAALGYLESSWSDRRAPKIFVDDFSTAELCRLYRVLDNIEETSNMADQYVRHVTGEATPVAAYINDLQEYLALERIDIVDALRDRPNTVDVDGQSRIATIVQFEAWCGEFHAETLDQLSASPLATSALGGRR